MERKAMLGMMLTLLLASMLTLAFNITVEGLTSDTTTVYIDQPTIRATAVGQEFNVTAYVKDVINLNAWQFGLTWNSTMLNCTAFTINYTFFGPEGDTLKVVGNINNTAGEIYPTYSVTFTTTSKAVNGTGPLASATFKAKATGTTDIHLAEVKLRDNTPAIIPTNIIDVFTVVPQTIVTVTNLTGLTFRYRLYGHAFNSTAREFSFNATGPSDNLIFCNVTIPKSLLNGGAEPWEVKLDGVDISFTKVENATHTSLYFTLTLSTHKVQVIKTPPDTEPPVADAGPDQTVNEDTIVTFDGSGSTDNVGIVNYTWTFMDVTPKNLTGVNPTYTFETPGIYTVTLNVTDAAENWDTDVVVITVLDITPPIADAGPDQLVVQGTTVTFDGSGSTDNVGIVSYVWTFTDVTPHTLTGINPNYKFNNVGNFEVTLNVTDPAGNWDADAMWVNVSADTTSPIANAGPDQTVYEDMIVTFDGSASWDDVGVVNYIWTFIDVTPQTLTGVSPTYNFTNLGIFTVTLNVTDVAGNWDTDTLVITVLEKVHDVAVTNVKPLCTVENLDPVTEGYTTWTINISVTVENQGNFTESFTVTANYENATGRYTIGTNFVTLNPGTSTTVNFTWNTAASVQTMKTYTISANASIVPGDINAANNYLVDGNYKLKYMGDASNDNFVDVDDLQIMGWSWQKNVGDAGYRAQADFNFDTLIDVDDLQIMGWNWLKP